MRTVQLLGKNNNKIQCDNVLLSIYFKYEIRENRQNNAK